MKMGFLRTRLSLDPTRHTLSRASMSMCPAGTGEESAGFPDPRHLKWGVPSNGGGAKRSFRAHCEEIGE